ncbi:dihydrofolate reductase [bacterium]|nr:dihydrofolate reductase [bacterium]
MTGPEIVIIAAIAEKNRVIGKEGKLPWHLSEDLRRFKSLTLGHAVLMGRKTFESILARLGKPLPERRSLVLTSKKAYPAYPAVETFSTLQSALDASREEPTLFVIGGERVFDKTLALADRLELTMVKGDHEGDAFFPEYKHLVLERFDLAEVEEREGYRFETYRTKPKPS